MRFVVSEAPRTAARSSGLVRFRRIPWWSGRVHWSCAGDPRDDTNHQCDPDDDRRQLIGDDRTIATTRASAPPHAEEKPGSAPQHYEGPAARERERQHRDEGPLAPSTARIGLAHVLNIGGRNFLLERAPPL